MRVARIEARPLIAPVAVSGLLVSREAAAVTSELAGFRVARVLVDQGAWVRAGWARAGEVDRWTPPADRGRTLRASLCPIVSYGV